MKKQHLIDFAQTLTKQPNLRILKQTQGGRSYQQSFTEAFTDVTTNHHYGVSISGEGVDYRFKTGEREDTIFKKFVTQYIAKYMMQMNVAIGDSWGHWTREECYDRLRKTTHITPQFFFPASYGIGWLCFLTDTQEFNSINKKMSDYLSSLHIPFENEYTEALWVYRFIIDGEDCEEVLANF